VIVSDHIEAFADAVTPFLRLYRSIEVRGVIVYAEDAWRNIRTLCRLRSEPPQELHQKETVTSPLFRTLQARLPIEQLRTLLTDVSTGTLVLGKLPIEFYKEQFNPNARAPYAIDMRVFHTITEAHRLPEFEWTGQLLRGSGDLCSTIVQRVSGGADALNLIARRSPRTPGSIDATVRDFIGVRDFSIYSHLAVLDIYAPLEARLVAEECRVSPGHVCYVVQTGSLQAAELCVLYISVADVDGRAQHLTHAFRASDWHAAGACLQTMGEVRAEGAASARIKLDIGGEVVHELELPTAAGSRSADAPRS
jgi:hypothetical protein